MRFFFKVLVLSILMLVIHLAISLAIAYVIGDDYGGYYGLMGGIIYYFAFGYWGYFVLSSIYCFATKNVVKRESKYLTSLIVCIIGYFFSRIPDLIDDDFFNNFSWKAFIVFLLLIPILVEIESLITKKYS
ncbi:MAG: hypothetical protein HRT61_18770 [Ekhidna sp.]|nr:hypothetical protein [Ekhidna sp.]